MTNLIQVRVDEILKKNADLLFGDLGLDTPTAIRIFLTQSVKQQKLPFEVKQNTPNAETIAAMREVEEMRKNPAGYKSYASADELFKDLENA